jgi:hypothetical protein
MGAKSAYNTRTGGFNSAFGSSAMYTNYSGNYNSAFGQRSLHYNYSGNYNTALGKQQLEDHNTELYYATENMLGNINGLEFKIGNEKYAEDNINISVNR